MRKFRDSVAKRCDYISYCHSVSAKIPNRNARKRLYRLKDKALSRCKTFHLQYLYRCRRGYVWKDVSRIFFFWHFLVYHAVLAVSGGPVEQIHDSVLERPRLSIGYHCLKCRIIGIRTCLGFVRGNVDWFYTFRFGKFTVNTDLSFYTLIVLILRTEPSGNDSVFHFIHEKICFFGKQPTWKRRNGKRISRK